MWKDFKEFAMQGNVIDMAVGVVIGGAFGKIVTSLVSDVIMPLIGLLTGGISFSDLKIVLSPEVVENGAVVTPANTINYGLFIDNILNFLIIAFCIFLVIRALQNAKKKFEKPVEEEPAEVVAPTSEELLGEIRDLLQAQNKAINKTE